MLAPNFKQEFERCRAILDELLQGEFISIKAEVRLYVGDEQTGALAWTWRDALLGGNFAIVLSTDHWKDNTSQYFGHENKLDMEAVRQTLRHELLHIETGLKDEDYKFIETARRRGIELEGNITRSRYY